MEAGIERVLIIVQQDDLHSFERLFKKPVAPADLAKLPKDKQVGLLVFSISALAVHALLMRLESILSLLPHSDELEIGSMLAL